MSRDYTYRRIDGRELSDRINHLGLSANDLMILSGARRDRVLQWLRGEEDIPPYVDQITRVWIDVPGSLEAAQEWAREVAVRAR